jgi:NAD(P)-dependent dehydrogenase (short-subunit alcohol dehydrogenase family)
MRGTVVITGGSRGIGAATARLAAERGWATCIGYLSRAAAADAVVADCRARGAASAAVQADVSVEADVLRLFERAEAEVGPVTGLVNNAGIVAGQSRVEDLDAERIVRMFAANAVGPFLCAREAVRRMAVSRGADGGAIVNLSSKAAVLGGPGEYVDYAASKAAVETLTVGLAREVAGDGIRVNAVRPGIIDTEIHASGGRPDRLQQSASSIPIGRGGQPEEVAEAIVWLLSDAASYVTGAVLDVTGGR